MQSPPAAQLYSVERTAPFLFGLTDFGCIQTNFHQLSLENLA